MVQARASTIAPPPPAPPQTAPPTIPAWPPDLALRKSVATLMKRCTALKNRFSALEPRIDGLVATQAANDSKLSSLVEAQQTIISTVTTLTEKIDIVVSRLEKLFEADPSPAPSPSPGRPSALAHQTSTSKYKVRHYLRFYLRMEYSNYVMSILPQLDSVLRLFPLQQCMATLRGNDVAAGDEVVTLSPDSVLSSHTPPATILHYQPRLHNPWTKHVSLYTLPS
ncbi:hypothetical protein Pmani_029063 [Petrolisthes manimaculis]|uniref:Uncharacterized protein n=1 Tax=Petrolisthes manimaculis TaxID=1843537 RepID=A0AAE1P0U7_9EUCA|nr:hypothetical protein Pmani_029063 [Petrolisthes manimaculis]